MPKGTNSVNNHAKKVFTVAYFRGRHIRAIPVVFGPFVLPCLQPAQLVAERIHPRHVAQHQRATNRLELVGRHRCDHRKVAHSV